jgi:mannose-6-phosphate isomerase-like protein (cupin superfamily)
MDKITILDKFELIQEFWCPKIVGELNGQQVKLAKFNGAFDWHFHENEDELFFVVKGKLRIEFRDRIVELTENEILIVPRGVEHKPVAEDEALVMLFEPASTLNTGNITNDRTKNELDRI